MPARRPSIARLVLPATLAVASAYALVGCIYIPILGDKARTPDGTDVRTIIGPATGDRPVRPGGVTRDAVLARLGPPTYRTAGGRAVAYEYEVVTGRWFGLCVSGTRVNSSGNVIFGIPSRVGRVTLLMLRFDEAGMLEHYDLQDDTGWQAISIWRQYIAPLGDPEVWPPNADPTRPATAPVTNPVATDRP